MFGCLCLKLFFDLCPKLITLRRTSTWTENVVSIYLAVSCLSVCVFLNTTSLLVFFRLYKNLPEVKAKNEEKKRLAFYRTNRLRAQLYDKVSGLLFC